MNKRRPLSRNDIFNKFKGYCLTKSISNVVCCIRVFSPSTHFYFYFKNSLQQLALWISDQLRHNRPVSLLTLVRTTLAVYDQFNSLKHTFFLLMVWTLAIMLSQHNSIELHSVELRRLRQARYGREKNQDENYKMRRRDRNKRAHA